MRFLRLLSACLLGLAALVAAPEAGAQSLINAPAYRAAGSPQQAIGVFCLNLDNTACSFGGSGTGGAVNQGSPGTSAWPMVIWQGGSPLSSGNPIFAQITGGTVTANLGTLNGAATAAKQPAPGTAGTPSPDVITVQGAVNGTAQPIIPQDGVSPAGYPVTLSATGPLAGIRTSGYGGLQIGLDPAFVGSISVEASYNSVDGSAGSGTWLSLPGYDLHNNPPGPPGSAMSNGLRQRLFPTAGALWVRINVTSVSTAGSAAAILRSGVPANPTPYIAGFVTTPAVNATLASTGTNRSTTIGTTAVTVMAANTGRRGWKIKNDSAGDIWINFDTTAAATPGGGNIKVAAGQYLPSEPGFVETGAMSAIGSAAGLAITFREH